MVCSNCGYPLGPDDQYCGGCGAYLTDSPEDEQPDQAPGSDHDTAAQDAPWGIPYAPAEQPPAPRSGPSAGMIAAAVAAVVLIALLVFWVLRPDSEESTASGSATAATTQTAPAATDGATATPTDGATDTPTASPTGSATTPPAPAEIDLPGAAQECDNVGSFVVYRGNTTTSCPFAENVGRAFAAVEQPVTAAVTLNDVSSPVTGLDYDLTCDFTTPVRCTGGNNAVVYLVPAS